MRTTRELTVPGRYDRIAEICAFVGAGAAKAGFDPDERFRIELATDEACTNVIQHAYGGEEIGIIRVSYEDTSDAFIIRIHDEGKPFDPLQIPAPNIPDSANDIDELRIGGLGIHFMRSLMDKVEFHPKDNGGNTLIMIKYRSEGGPS